MQLTNEDINEVISLLKDVEETVKESRWNMRKLSDADVHMFVKRSLDILEGKDLV